MGRKNGDWKRYDETGLLIITINYQGGREVKYDGFPVDMPE
jgi:antitoxin component YwqK of YwqJK toxin-antitoxin module